MGFFNRVVEIELRAEREARDDKLLGVVVATGLVFLVDVAGVLEIVPRKTEVIMLFQSQCYLRNCGTLRMVGCGRLTNWSICIASRL